MTSLRLSVAPTSHGERLDRFLARAQTDLSRSRLQTLIRAGCVRVNGAAGKAGQRLREGARIEVELPAAPPDSALEAEALELTIVHEDADVMVVDKPAGMVVHPGAGVSRGTLVQGLLQHAPTTRGVGGPTRPGIVHRLDKDTSGLMLVAKTDRAHRALVEAMRRREVTRVYRALVWGDPRRDGGEIATELGRDPKQRKRMAVVTRGGRPAVTHWEVERRFGAATLLRVRLETGRTHQIRVHLEHLGHPVVGDPTYRGRPKNLLSLRVGERSLATDLLAALPRQGLHAAEIAFTHPTTGERHRFMSPLPADLTRALARLEAYVRGTSQAT
jgi:23S rRNA pseudouridine1911/1915/1917 synthase